LPEPPADTVGYPPLGASRPPEADENVDAPTERLPIYEAVLSQWFEAADTGSMRRTELSEQPEAAENGTNGANGAPLAEETTDVGQQPPVAEQGSSLWTSPGDDGWLAAQSLLENTPESQTTAGLPKRVPKAHLVPGSAAPRHAAAAAETAAAPPLPPRSAEAVRGRMSSFQQGVRRGRHALIDAYAGDQSGSEDSRKDEEQE
jgi:hypothetical protein